MKGLEDQLLGRVIITEKGVRIAKHVYKASCHFALAMFTLLIGDVSEKYIDVTSFTPL